MLAEAFSVAKSLEREGIIPDATSGDMRTPGATSGAWARVLLNAEGALVNIGEIEKDDAPGLWTIMEGNQNSFPVVRFKKPLLRLSAEHPLWSLLTEASRRKESDSPVAALLLEHLDPEQAESPDAELWKRLSDRKAPEVSERAREVAPEVEELSRRFIISAADPDAFAKVMARRMLEKLREGDLSLVRFARELLIGKEPKGGKHETSIQLAFDLHPESTIYRRKVKIAMSAAKSDARTGAMVSVCAYAGDCNDALDEPFPKVRVPVLGRDFPLLSMFSEAQCNVRYGLSDERIVPISAATVRAAHGALSHILSSELADETWRAVASGQFDKKDEVRDLLVIYIGKADAPKSIPSSFLAGVPAKGDYPRETKALIEAYKGIALKNPSQRLQIFILKAVSKGQAQAVYAEQPLVKDVYQGALAWQAGQVDRIDTILDSFTEPKQPASPEDAVRVLADVWAMDGSKSTKLQAISLGQALDLLIRQPGRSDDVARTILHLVPERTAPLFSKLVRDKWQRSSGRGLEVILARRAINFLSLALSHLGIGPDITMKEPAYLVGRLLSLSDKLHIQYCRVVRGGDIPPTLIGNSLLGTALDHPVSALATLADRLRIYLGWAQSAEVPDGGQKAIAIKTAKKTLREFSEVEAELSEKLTDARCTDLMKAQMLLGYLARAKSDPEPELASAETDTDSKEKRDAQ